MYFLYTQVSQWFDPLAIWHNYIRKMGHRDPSTSALNTIAIDKKRYNDTDTAQFLASLVFIRSPPYV